MVESAIVSVLAADDPLTDVLTGGVYSYKAIGKKGLVSSNPVVSDAWATTNNMKFLKPCCVVKVRSKIYDYQRSDVYNQETSWNGTVEMWLYDADDWDAITTAGARIRRLLHQRGFTSIGFMQFIGALEGFRAEELSDAALLRLDFNLKAIERLQA